VLEFELDLSSNSCPVLPNSIGLGHSKIVHVCAVPVPASITLVEHAFSHGGMF